MPSIDIRLLNTGCSISILQPDRHFRPMELDTSTYGVLPNIDDYPSVISSNNEHPELHAGELWLCNTGPKTWEKIGYATKRLGQVAYTTDGRYVPGVRPVFVGRSEYDDRMAEIANLNSRLGIGRGHQHE